MLWIGGIVLLVVAAGLLVATFSEKRRFALLATTERSTAAELNAMAAAVAAEIGAGSFHQIAEVAGTTRCQQPLTSELTSTPCVHYQMSVTREYEETYYETDDKNQRVRRERRGSETVAENRRSCSFEVEDATGRVTVDPRDAKIIPEKVCDRFDSGDPHTPKLEIGSWKLDLSALTVREGRRTLGFRYEERIVPIDRAIFVLGEASDRSGQLVIGKPARKGATFLVSTKSEEALLADARSNARWLLTGTIVAALAGAVLVRWAPALSDSAAVPPDHAASAVESGADASAGPSGGYTPRALSASEASPIPSPEAPTPAAPAPRAGAVDLRSLSPAELRERVLAHKAPAYRAEQLFRWLHGSELDAETGLPRSLRDKSNVPKELREALLAEAPLRPLTVEALQQAKDGTRKFRFRTFDGRAIESVLIPDDNQERGMLTLCISSQVGCALDCQFCATATLGFSRHLSAGEIVEQVAQATAVAGRRPTNIVFMGMGEPLHNVANVKRAFELLLHPWGAGFSPRRITVSTVGLVSGIDELAQLSPAPNLAISLNATTDEVRSRIMPVNKRWPIAKLLEATKKYPLGHNRRLTFEYVLLAGVNDSDADAARLPRLLRGLPCKVNLIPWNPFAGPAFERPSEERILSFQQIVRAGGLPVYIRTPRGDDIDAACGQLAARPVPTLVALGLPVAGVTAGS